MSASNPIIDYQIGAQDEAGVIAPPFAHNPDDHRYPLSEKTTLHDVGSEKKGETGTSFSLARLAEDEQGDGRPPTQHELDTLRKVAGKIPWTAYIICVVEFAERASYYGCQGIFNNFIQRPLPAGGNGAGAPPKGSQLTAGALDMGLVPATALTTLFTFLAYTIPIAGAILSDTKWGRFKTASIGVAIGVLGHILLIIAAIPAVIQSGRAIGPFIIGLLVLAGASGLIKPCIAPLLADQSPIKKQEISTLPSGEVVILDPGQTIQSMMLFFYWAINIGALLQLATTYCEKDVGYWLAYLVPGIIYMLVPAALWFVYNKLIMMPPQGSIILDAGRVCAIAIKNRSWDAAKPSVIEATLPVDARPKGYQTWDDEFIPELKQTISVSKLFLFFVVFNLADSGLSTIQNNQAASLTTNGAPNDLLSNFNSICIIVLIPILDYGLYPLLRKHKINFTPIMRIIFGFFLAALGMMVNAIIQWKVYETSPCGYYASTCDIGTTVSPISVWVTLPSYALPAAGECFAIITSYELAYTLAPQRMKGLVFAINLFMSALSSAIVEIISSSMVDPHLIYPYVGIAAAIVLCCVAMWVFFRDLDRAIMVDRPLQTELQSRAKESGGKEVA